RTRAMGARHQHTRARRSHDRAAYREPDTPSSQERGVEIRLVDMSCPPGRHPVAGVLQAWFHVWDHGQEGIGWWRKAKSRSDLFTALTTHDEPKPEEMCVPVMPMARLPD